MCALTNEHAQHAVDLPMLGWWDLHLDVDVEARLQRVRAEGGEGREVIWPVSSSQTLHVPLSLLERLLTFSDFLQNAQRHQQLSVCVTAVKYPNSRMRNI